MAELTMTQAQELERLEPFGVGNQTPSFILRDAVLHRVIPLGGGKHTKLMVYKDGQLLPAIWFSMSPQWIPAVVGDSVDLLFQLNINDYQGVRSLQLILQDLRPSASVMEDIRHRQNRYREVLEGAPISESEHLVPDRGDIAAVFTILRQDARLGIQTFTEQNLRERVNRSAPAAEPMNLLKLRFILRILGEMGVSTTRELGDGVYGFEVNFAAPKTSIDASPLLCSLRKQLAAGEA
jgi:hypothetical protein